MHWTSGQALFIHMLHWVQKSHLYQAQPGGFITWMEVFILGAFVSTWILDAFYSIRNKRKKIQESNELVI
jgi:uncharacterized membrane protein (DUF485 family)